MKLNKRGYTLIEVLIASLIFSSIIFLSIYALEQGIRQYKGILERGFNFWERARFFLLQRSLASAIDYYVYDERKKFWHPFFRGGLDIIAYVSLAPFSHDTPVLVILKKEEREGKFDLVYYESPVYTANLKEIEDILLFQTYKREVRLIFFEGLDFLEFKYYGYDRFRRFNDWFSEFDSARFLQLPLYVKIEYNKGNFRDSLFLPLNVQNFRKGFYNEFYPKK